MKRNIILGCLLFVVAACQEDEQQPQTAAIPEVTKILPARGQSGDTIVIEGANFSAQTELNEVAVNGTPASVIAASADRITAIVPLFCQTGNLLISVNNVSIPGPVFTVIPSPTITSISPNYGFAGDTLTLAGYHFAPDKDDNFIALSGLKASVVKQQGDTLLKVIIPAGDGSGKLSFHTFNGTAKEYAKKFQLRKPYTGNILEAIRQDPAFSYTNAILERMKEIYPAFHHKIDSIWNSLEPHTIFLRDNDALRKQNKNFTSVEYVRQNADPQSFYYNFLWATTKGNLTEDLFDNAEYPSELSEEEAFGGPGSGGRPDFFIPIVMFHTPDQTSVSLFFSDPVKIILTDLKATNGTIHQLE